MKPLNHIQCVLSKGPARQIAWLPEKHARVGDYVSLKLADDSWEDGWKVDSVGANTVLPSKWIAERTQDHKNMKTMTDI